MNQFLKFGYFYLNFVDYFNQIKSMIDNCTIYILNKKIYSKLEIVALLDLLQVRKIIVFIKSPMIFKTIKLQ